MADEFSIKIGGFELKGFTSARITKSLNSFTNTFEIKYTQKEEDSLTGSAIFSANAEIKVQDEVEVSIGGTLVMTGFVEHKQRSLDARSHTLEISGRDKTGDLIDSSIIPKEYTQSNILSLFNQVLSTNDYTGLSANFDIPNTGIINPSLTRNNDQGFNAITGMTIFDFFDKYAKKVQLLLRSSSRGNVLLTKEGTIPYLTPLLSLKGGAALPIGGGLNNIISVSSVQNSTDRYRFIEIRTEGDSSENFFGGSAVLQIGSSEDKIIRTPRRKIVLYDAASDKGFLDDLAKWNVRIKRAKGSFYECRVLGYRPIENGPELWQENRIVTVRDTLSGLDGPFLIEGVTYTKSLDGSFTDFRIVPQGSYNIDKSNEADEEQLETSNFF